MKPARWGALLVALPLLAALGCERTEYATHYVAAPEQLTLYFNTPPDAAADLSTVLYTLGNEVDPLLAGELRAPDFRLELADADVVAMHTLRLRACGYDAEQQLRWMRYWEAPAAELIGTSRVVTLEPLVTEDAFPMPAPYPDHDMSSAFAFFAFQDTLRDANGVPMHHVWGYADPVYSRHWICKLAIAYFEVWTATGIDSCKTRSLWLTDWLLDQAVETPLDGLAVPEPFDFESRVWMRAPWNGIFTHSMFLSALVRAHLMSGEERYLAAAQAALRTFTVPIGHWQGVLCVEEGDEFWPEEYPSFRPQHTLNGGIFAIWGLLDWWFVTGDPQGERLYRAFIRTLERDLPLYDTGSWTYYDQWQKLAPQSYHQIHISQMNILYRQTGLQVFADYRDLWQSYLPAPQ